MMYENFMRFWLSLVFVVRLKRMKIYAFIKSSVCDIRIFADLPADGAQILC